MGEVDVVGDFALRGLPCARGASTLVELDSPHEPGDTFHRDFDLAQRPFVALRLFAHEAPGHRWPRPGASAQSSPP